MPIPNEILNLIASFSCKYQQHECLFVCHNWLASFKPCLYQTIHIKSRKLFRQLINSIQHNNQTGFYIKNLFFDHHVGITRDEFKTLFRLLPLLEKVDFNPELWKYFPYQQNSDTTAKWKRIKKLPLLTKLSIARLVFPNYSSSLVELSMTASFFVNNDIISYYNPASTQSVQPLRRLQVYGNCYTEFTLKNLITIHSELPLLEELELLDFTFIASSTDDDSHGSVAAMTHQQYKKMKRFHLQGKINHSHWISLISRFYPNLLDLKLNLKTYAGQQKQQDVRKDRIITIAKDCRLLENIKLNGIDPSILLAFYTTLASTSAARGAIKSIDGITPINATKSFSTAVLNCCNAKETNTLKLQLWRDLVSFDNIMHSISNQCHHLKSLELNCGKYAFSWNYGFDVNTIFKYSPQLKELVLSMGKMTVQKNNSTNYTTRIESVTLIQVHFTTKSINYLTKCCPNLTQFKILDCIKNRDKLQQKISIDLSHQLQLDTLDIQHIYLRPSRFIEKSSIDVALLSITQPDGEDTTRWYHLNNRKCGRNRKNILQLRRLDETQSNQVSTYQMSQKDWDHLEQETSVRGTYREFKYWTSDLPYGQLELICSSNNVKQLIFNK